MVKWKDYGKEGVNYVEYVGLSKIQYYWNYY